MMDITSTLSLAVGLSLRGGGGECPLPGANLHNNNKAWQSICIAHGVRCVADRSWKFFTPLYLSRSCGGSLKPTAAIALAENLAVAALSTPVANVYKETERTIAVTVLENLSVIVGGAMLLLFVVTTTTTAARSNNKSPLRSPFFLLAMACSCIDSVCSTLLSNTISKEWVAALFHSNNKDEEEGSSRLLASANARMSQIDLAVATICPLLVSFLIERVGGGNNNYKTVLLILLAQHAIGTSVVVWNMKRAVHHQPNLSRLHNKQKKASSSEDDKKDNNNDDTSTKKKKTTTATVVRNLNPLHIFVDGSIPPKTRLVTLAYVLLYCTVLSPGPIMNAWLNSMRQKKANAIDIKEGIIAWFGSSAQLFGTLATLITPPLIRCLGKHGAGLLLQCFQGSCIVAALISFLRIVNSASSANGANDNARWLVFGFLVPIAASRIGLWGFDLAERQVLQETVPREKQTIYFNAERSLTRLASLVMTYLCYAISDPESFGTLVKISAGAVVLASATLGLSSFFSTAANNDGQSQ